MVNILAFVEGTMERIFINNNFPYVEVVPVSNGKTWTTEGLAKQIISKYRSKKFLPHHIVIWIDRENNTDDCHKMAAVFRDNFKKEGYSEHLVHCLIPDMMSENIILSDEHLVREITNDPEYKYQNEGQNGKHHIKEIWKSINVDYKPTTHGPRLLKRVRLSRCNVQCSGVKQFLDTFTFPCWWVEQEE